MDLLLLPSCDGLAQRRTLHGTLPHHQAMLHPRCIAVLRRNWFESRAPWGGDPVHSDEWLRLTLEQSAYQKGSHELRVSAIRRSAATCLSWWVLGPQLTLGGGQRLLPSLQLAGCLASWANPTATTACSQCSTAASHLSALEL
jgi:hypothetical protein